MKLLPNEEKLITSNGEKVILTNHRIQMDDSSWGKSFTISIFLEDISSIEIKYKSNLIFIILGVPFILAGVVLSKIAGEMFGLGLVIGLILIALWFFSRKHVISISSNGGSVMNFLIKGMSDENVAEFVYNVSQAKQTRVNLLHKV